jgi:polysaccharide export outer membrane protein
VTVIVTTRTVLLSVLFSWLVAASASIAAGAPQAAPGDSVASPSKDLVEYIRDARSLGLKDSELRQNAIKAGWKSDLVDSALRSVDRTEPSSSDPTKTGDTRPDRAIAEQYVIGAGDVLQVAVWKEPDASVQSVAVRADGKITLPFIREVEVAGLTVAKAEELLTTLLKPFYKEPDVTLIIREVHSKKIYLVGALKHGGTVDLKYPMTVLQALTEGGGLTDFAKRKKIYVLRTENGKQYRFPFNYDAVIRGELMEQNIWVMANDMIVVPQ